MNTNKKVAYEQIKALLVLSATFLWIFLLNMITPRVADDFSYIYSFKTGARLNNVIDLLLSVRYFYTSWSGRLVLSFFAQLFMMVNKLLFNFTNASMYTALIYLICKHISGTGKTSALHIYITAISVWLLTPVFGQTMLWNTGAIIYLWGAVLVMLFLLPYRLLLDKYSQGNLFFSVIMFFLGIIAGLTMKNLAISALCVCSLLMLTAKKRVNIEGNKIPIWCYTGFFGAIIGFIILIVSPGNYVRSSAAGISNGFISINSLAYNLSYALIISSVFLFIPGLILLFFMIFNAIQKKKKQTESCKEEKLFLIYLTGSAIGIFSMAASPGFPPRAVFAPFLFLIISVSIYATQSFLSIFTKHIRFIIAILLLLSVYTGLNAVMDLSRLNTCWKQRTEYIASLDNPASEDIAFDIFVPKTMYNPIYALVDLRENSAEWPNPEIAKTFGVKSIRGIKTSDGTTILDYMYKFKDIISNFLHKKVNSSAG